MLANEFEADHLSKNTDYKISDYLTRSICETLMQHNSEGVMLTDATSKIVLVNDAFCKITGYSKSEALGKTPALLRSTHHATDFYQKMWVDITTNGQWQGLIWNRRKDCSIYQQWLKVTAIYNQEKQITHYLALFQDLTKLQLHDTQTKKIALTDSLTKLGNRELLISRFSQLLAQCALMNLHLDVIWIDGSQLAQVNQQHGLKVGDLLIKAHAKRLSKLTRSEQTLVRLYADDFVLLSISSQHNNAIESQLQYILNAMRQPYIIEDISISVIPALGVARFPQDGSTEEQLLQAAETAMLEAKKQGGNKVTFYNAEQGIACQRRNQIRQLLQYQLTNKGSGVELSLHFQPKVVMRTCKLYSAEALIRWNSSELGVISPMEFIPIAEESRVIIQLDRWVITELCKILHYLKNAHLLNFTAAFNVSSKQLMEADFVSWLKSCLDEYDICPSSLEMEVTESAFIHDPIQALACLSGLKQLGLKIALDDFGTGYSSLEYLKVMPLDTVKIDRSVLFDITSNDKAKSIVKNLKRLASDLALQMVVEGVETEDQHELLKQLGCDFAQGYYYHKPLALSEFLVLINDNNKH